MRRFTPFLITLIIGVAISAYIFPIESKLVEQQIIGFPDADIDAQRLRPWLLSLLFFLPAIGALFYGFANTIDRYVTRQFLSIFFISLTALLVVRILIDLEGNLDEIADTKNPTAVFFGYYATQMPSFLVLMLPFALLLTLLYCLGKLSGTREIVSIIQTGQSVFRLIAPMIFFGILCAAACLIFNYHWAPWADGYRDAYLEEAQGGNASQARDVIFFSEKSQRLWKVGHFPYSFADQQDLEKVEVTQKTSTGHIDSRLNADSAFWDLHSGKWTFTNAQITKFHTNGIPIPDNKGRRSIETDWNETPWQIIKPGLPAPYLGIPGLNSWLKANKGGTWLSKLPYLTQWHYRWAQPFLCLVIVLLAAPLGIVFSRRGAIGGVVTAIALSACMLFASNIFLALGESSYLPPLLAAWATNILFSIIAGALIHRRVTGRPIYQTMQKTIGKFTKI